MYYVSLKGRVFLDLLRKYVVEKNNQAIISQEISYLFKMLGVDLLPSHIVTKIDYKEGIGFIRSYELANRSNLSTFYNFTERLGMGFEEHYEESLEAFEPLRNYLELERQINFAKDYWDIDLTAPLQFIIHEDENNPHRSLVR